MTAYRRALQPFDVREHVVPLLAQALTDEPAAHERALVARRRRRHRSTRACSPTADAGHEPRHGAGRGAALRRSPRFSPAHPVTQRSRRSCRAQPPLPPRSRPSSRSPSAADSSSPSGEIYGGTRSAWDYGPLGVELKDNIKRQWWQTMVTGREDVVGLDSSVILPRQVWVASGHVNAFTDPLVECQQLPQALPRRPARRGVQRAHGGKRGSPRTTCPRCRARTAAPAGSTPRRASST